ncbi:hypothetical protein F4821DRAFT_190061 [Hypoxylon rubiginosum]|uniref:Uncharacterized protein n=1 Tax=Hypoxylon rubiginosum TaxID=110542 RepID=A0ACC0CU12_9PEZI|nr:hypothetical protein F4821DRAFT_190061 [Hypoxylon rubiginosum]
MNLRRTTAGLLVLRVFSAFLHALRHVHRVPDFITAFITTDIMADTNATLRRKRYNLRPLQLSSLEIGNGDKAECIAQPRPQESHQLFCYKHQAWVRIVKGYSSTNSALLFLSSDMMSRFVLGWIIPSQTFTDEIEARLTSQLLAARVQLFILY